MVKNWNLLIGYDDDTKPHILILDTLFLQTDISMYMPLIILQLEFSLIVNRKVMPNGDGNQYFLQSTSCFEVGI